MKLNAKANQLKKQLAVGIWLDQEDRIHLSIQDLLAYCDLENTEENRKQCMDMMTAMLKKSHPNMPVLYRRSPTDDGEDIR